MPGSVVRGRASSGRVYARRGNPAGGAGFLGEFHAPQVEAQPEPEIVAVEAPVPVVSLFGKKIQLYDPQFAPTRWILSVVERLRG